MEQVFLKLLNMSISASYLVLAVVVLRPLLKKAPKALRCALWGLVGLRLLLPVSIESVLSLIPSAETVPTNIAMMPVPAITSGIAAVNSYVNPTLAQSMTPAAGASVNPVQLWSFMAAWVWLIGMILMLLYALGSSLWLRRRVRTAVRLEAAVWKSEQVTSPFVFGLFCPRIYLPFELSDEEMQSVLAHERAHIARRDHLIKPLGFLLLSVYWFNPVLWLAYVLLCRDIELACDEKVIRHMDVAQRKAYSAALLKCSIHRGLAACPLAFGEVGVKQRVKSVLHYKKPAFWLILLAVVVSIVLAVCFLTDPAAPRFDPERDIIVSATTMDLRQSSGAVSLELNPSELDELADRLRDLKKTRKGDAYKGQRICYILSIELESGEWIYLRGYALDGSALDMVRDGTVYRVADQEFQRYVEQLCTGEMRTGSTSLLDNAVAYVFDRAIYMNLLSSYFPVGTTGYRYVLGENYFQLMDQETGERLRVYSGDWRWQSLTQEALEDILFTGKLEGLKEFFTVDVSAYEKPMINSLSDGMHLLDMDGELWVIQNGNVYALAPESEKYQTLGQADLDHDGENENIFYSPDVSLGCCLWVFDREERLLWDRSLNENDAYYLCTLEGEDYLLHYRRQLMDGSGRYSYELFYTDGNERTLGKQTVKSRMLEFSLSGDMDSREMADFADEVNELLTHSTLLISTQDGVLRLGPEAGANDWERYEFLDECAELYAAGDSLADKLEKYADYHAAQTKNEPNTIPMLTNQLLNLAWQERDLTWEDLRPYVHEDIGSGVYVYVYEVGERFQLIVSSPFPDTTTGVIRGNITLVAGVDGEEVTWGEGDMADFIFRKLSRDTSPLVVSGRSYIMAVGAESSVQPSVLYIDPSHGERYAGPFTVYINGEDYDGGLYSVRETLSGEKVDVIMPSGLSQRLFVLQNTQPGLLYDVSLRYYDEQAKAEKTAVFRVMTDGT